MRKIELIGFEKPLTSNDYKPLRRAYNEAVEHGSEEFVYKGNELLTEYARCCLEYMENLKMTEQIK